MFTIFKCYISFVLSLLCPTKHDRLKVTMIFEIICSIQLSSSTFTFLILETTIPLVMAFPKLYIHNAVTDTVKAVQN